MSRRHPASRQPFRALNRALSWLQLGRAPLFLSGHGRSGTTWIGHTLSRARGVLYYDEPCNPDRVDGDPSVWFRHVPATGRDAYFEQCLAPAFRGLVCPGAGIWLKRRAYRRLLPGYRVVVKDVASCMASEWIAQRYHPRVLMVIRHPCAVVLSERAKGAVSAGAISRLLEQRPLVEEHLAPYLSVLESARTPLEIYGALWAARARVVADQLQRHPEWILLVYEQLSREPVAGFHHLFDSLGLTWDSAVDAFVRRSTTEERPGMYSVYRHSQSHADQWRHQMSRADIQRLRAVIQPFQLPFYDSDGEWAPA